MNLRSGILLCLLCMPFSVAWGQSLSDEIVQDLKSPMIVTQISGGGSLRLPELLAEFYATRHDAPGWVDETGPLPAVQQMLEAIRHSRDDGLLPADYHFHSLNRLLDSLHEEGLTPDVRRQRLGALELLLSDAFLLLSDHELNGRVDPADMDPLVTVQVHRQDLTVQLQAVLKGADPEKTVFELAPHDPDYQAMRAELARYYSLAINGGLPEVPGGISLRIGDSGPRVEALIKRLEVEGDLEESLAQDAMFTLPVENALKHFQLRHGLNSDGVAGAATLAALNQPVQTWINRLRVNMERWRWLPQRVGDTRIVVNIANFRATLYENGKALLTEPVIVGQPYRQTPEFSDRIQYLVINPAWDVPPTITAEDLLPKVQDDPGYLARHGYVVLQGWGTAERPVDPHSIDWKRWTAETLPYRFRQLPGPENALGRVKFMFPNRFGVYLHDTPAQGLFAAGRRTFSSGCIRVAHALTLAAALMQLDGRANPDEYLDKVVASGATKRVDLTHPVPIYIMYLTAWVDDAGVLEFRQDVYDRDPEILRALQAPLPEKPQCCIGSALH